LAWQIAGDSIKGHCIMEPGPKRDVWIDLVDAGGNRLASPTGKNASLLVNLCYEPSKGERLHVTSERACVSWITCLDLW
jgi:hypothetical protein